MMTESAAGQQPRNPADHLGPYQFRPGRSGNPAGRSQGSRNKLGEAFIEKLYAHWLEHGDGVIDRAAIESPAAYLRVIASILPKQLEIRSNAFDGITDEQLAAILAAARDALGAVSDDRGGTEQTAH
jgi:Family of unknown function (DUF5681)